MDRIEEIRELVRECRLGSETEKLFKELFSHISSLEKKMEKMQKALDVAKDDHWGGHFAKCPVLHCPVCDALKEVEE